jgi:hypothetical protein
MKGFKHSLARGYLLYRGVTTSPRAKGLSLLKPSNRKAILNLGKVRKEE